MSSNSNGASPDSSTLDLAQAFKEIARGEQTAATLESNLSSLEAKLDAMLAGLEEQEQAKSTSTTSAGGPKTQQKKQKEINDEEQELKMDREEDDELKALKAGKGADAKTFEK